MESVYVSEHVIERWSTTPQSPGSGLTIIDNKHLEPESCRTDHPECFGQELCFSLIAPSVSTSLSADQQEACRTAIRALHETANSPNWNGEAADPVTSTAIEMAENLVKYLPGEVDPPSISAAPEGSVEFDWHLDNGTMFTISVGATGDLAIAGLHDGEATLNGLQWDRKQNLRALLNCGLEWLRNMQAR